LRTRKYYSANFQQAQRRGLRQNFGEKYTGEPVKDVTHLRVVTWDNMRKRVMVKAKKLKKTGEGGAEILEMDSLVLNIIGRDLAILKGF